MYLANLKSTRLFRNWIKIRNTLKISVKYLETRRSGNLNVEARVILKWNLQDLW